MIANRRTGLSRASGIGSADAVLQSIRRPGRFTQGARSLDSRQAWRVAAARPASRSSEDLLGDDAAIRKGEGTLDVGSIRSTIHRCADRKQRRVPADLYLEGSDQHRGWFHSSLLGASMMDGVPPYKALLTHGFVIDLEGRKMSKSKGNAMSPQNIVDTLGADILRLWVASSDYSGELTISNEILKRVVESYRRIRNTLRFLLANLDDSISPATGCRPTMGPIAALHWRSRQNLQKS